MADVRAWAREQGLPVGDRGRLPAKLVEQYDAAHPRGTAKAAKAKAKATAPSTAARPAKKPAAASDAVRPAARQRPAPAAPVQKPVEAVAPSAAPIASDKASQDLDLVRSEVADLRKHLEEVLARLTTLEQPRSLFNRSKGKR